MLVEKRRVSELSAQSLGRAHSVKSILCPVLCVVFSLSVIYFVLHTGRHSYFHQAGG